MRKIVFFILLLIFSSESFATNRYVDSVNGLDTNDGTSWATAFKTVTPLNSIPSTSWASGDTVKVRNNQRILGTFAPIMPTSISASNPVVFTAENPYAPINELPYWDDSKLVSVYAQSNGLSGTWSLISGSTTVWAIELGEGLAYFDSVKIVFYGEERCTIRNTRTPISVHKYTYIDTLSSSGADSIYLCLTGGALPTAKPVYIKNDAVYGNGDKAVNTVFMGIRFVRAYYYGIFGDTLTDGIDAVSCVFDTCDVGINRCQDVTNCLFRDNMNYSINLALTSTHNTFIRGANHFSSNGPLGGGAYNTVVKNNIFYMPSGVFIMTADYTTGSCTAAGNIYIASSLTNKWQWASTFYSSIADFDANAEVTDASTISGTTLDVGFKNVANGDYSLTAGSPAFGAGVAGTGITKDMIGVQRAAIPCSGAYELLALGFSRYYLQRNGSPTPLLKHGSPAPYTKKR